MSDPATGLLIYADGSALGNPGPGGWGFLVLDPASGEILVQRSGSEAHSTNNRMELTAAIAALDALPDDAAGTLRTDSRYVVDGVNAYRPGWQRRGWRTAANRPIANLTHWLALFDLVDARPGISFAWVKGHADDPYNALVDEMATAASAALRAAHPRRAP